MKIKYIDLQAQYLSIKDEIDKSIKNVISESAFSGGRYVKKFEEKFSEYCDVKFSAGVSSGTSALWITLKALDVGPGDEVITVPNTFIATAEAITFCGATPVFVDINPYSCTMDPHAIESKITEKTKAIIPVHLYGQMAEMEPILSIAKKYGLKVVEDAAQAHGAERNGVKPGGFGDAACFSFYPGKNLGAFGEAGAVITNNEELYDKVCMIRDHGQKKKYFHVCNGLNERMDGLQGAILEVKLKYLDEWNLKRSDIAAIYNQDLNGKFDLRKPYALNGNKHVYHIYQIQLKNRNFLKNKIEKMGISCGIHYPVPIHMQISYVSSECKKENYPFAEKLSETTLSLPIYPEMSVDDIYYVVNSINDIIN